MKKALSILLAVLICVSVVAVTSSANDEPLTAYNFEIENYDESVADENYRAPKVETTDGAVRISSDRVQHRYQAFFEVTDQQAMKQAIKQACAEDGFLSVDIVVNSALTIYGSFCRPTIEVGLMKEPNDTKYVATTGENKLYSEQAGQFVIDVNQFREEEYTNQIKWVYVEIQCYDWGCGGGLGTQPDVTVYPIKVYRYDDTDFVVPSTMKPDPDNITLLNFSPNAKVDTAYSPEQVHYSSDGVTWRLSAFAKEENYGYARFSQMLNSSQKMQITYTIDQMGQAAADAFNLAKTGSGYLNIKVNLQECVNMQGNPTIAEIGIKINTRAGVQSVAPEPVGCLAWQYPGTTRNYYLDVSKINHISQIESVTIYAQNYLWYNAETNELFDWNRSDEEAEALGHTKCEIKTVIIASPITLYDGDREVQNTPYDLVLNDFNKNGGVVPEKITVIDYNDDIYDDIYTTTSTTEIANPSTCVHKTKVKNKVKSTYFKKGYTGDKVCAKCGKTVKKGKKVDKFKLKTPKFKLIKGKKQFKVKYTKVKDATGFQVRYKIKGKWKTKTFNSKKTTTKVIKKLKKGTYQVQVRAMIKQGKKTAYSTWSKTKKVKVK